VNNKKIVKGGYMSRTTRKPPIVKIDKTELKFIIRRHYGDQKDFCKACGFNHGTLRHYLNGRNMPAIDRKILPIIQKLGYKPDGTRNTTNPKGRAE
jgi:hypothetical protein